MLVLTSAAEVMVTDGETRTFPGSVLLMEDTAGEGHQTLAVGTAECAVATAVLPSVRHRCCPGLALLPETGRR